MSSTNNQPLDFITGLFSSWNICCIFPMLILVDRKSSLSLLSNRQIPLHSQYPTRMFLRSECSCTSSCCLSNMSTSFLRCGYENRADCSSHSPVLLCTEINPGRSSSCACSGHSAKQRCTRSWHFSGYFPSLQHLYISPMVQGMVSSLEAFWPPQLHTL